MVHSGTFNYPPPVTFTVAQWVVVARCDGEVISLAGYYKFPPSLSHYSVPFANLQMAVCVQKWPEK